MADFIENGEKGARVREKLNAAAGPLVIDVSHPETLDEVESAAASIVFTGALSGSRTFVLSGAARVQRLTNNTAGAFDLFVRRNAGAAYFIPQNEAIEVR